jgi:hypothetical protein
LINAVGRVSPKTFEYRDQFGRSWLYYAKLVTDYTLTDADHIQRDMYDNTPIMYRFLMHSLTEYYEQMHRYDHSMYYSSKTALIANKFGQVPLTLFDDPLYLVILEREGRTDLFKYVDIRGVSVKDRLKQLSGTIDPSTGKRRKVKLWLKRFEAYW